MKKVLWIMGTIAVCVIYSLVVGVVLVIGNIIVSIVTRSEIQQLNQDAFNVVAASGCIVLTILSIWLFRRWKMKCHACKRWGAMKRIQTELLKQEDISVLMEMAHRNVRGDYIGSHEQYIPGKRKIYKDTYKCQYCGNFESYTYTKDKASI